MNKITDGWWAIIGTAILALTLVPYLIPPTVRTQRIDNAVNLFPQNTEAKNYRLMATVETTVHYEIFFRQKKEYRVKDIRWPNGGAVEARCNGEHPFRGSQRVACFIGDDVYKLELNQPDAYPEA